MIKNPWLSLFRYDSLPSELPLTVHNKQQENTKAIMLTLVPAFDTVK